MDRKIPAVLRDKILCYGSHKKSLESIDKCQWDPV